MQYALGAIAAEKQAEEKASAVDQSELTKLKKEVQLHRWVIIFLIIYIFFFKNEHEVRHTNGSEKPDGSK
jgi:hypothetical protein